MKRTAPKQLLTGQTNVHGIAVDGQRKYLFVNQNDKTAGTGTVTSYKLHTNFTNTSDPIVTIDDKEKSVVVYKGGVINGLVVSELLGVLLIADSTHKKITAYEYDLTILKT